MLLAAPSVAVLPALAAGFRCPLPVVGEVAARRLATFVASPGGTFAVIGEVAWVGLLCAATLSGPLLITSHVLSPCHADGLGE